MTGICDITVCHSTFKRDCNTRAVTVHKVLQFFLIAHTHYTVMYILYRHHMQNIRPDL